MQPLFMSRLRLMNYVMRRGFSFCTKPPLLLSNSPATPISQHELVDEETGPAYDPKSYYPAKPGEILANHYQLLVKIGWGTRSTVWLARDITRYRWQTDRWVTLKILNNNRPEDARDERAIEEQIAQKCSSHRGSAITRTCLDSLEVNGPEGNHLCLAYEPMREPLWIYQRRFPGMKLPLSIAKAYICILLTGLDYLHTECKVVHTDLKLENILMTFENENILPAFIEHQSEKLPMQYKSDTITGRTVYLCHNDFGPLDRKSLKRMVPKIADFGLATKLDNEIGIHIIQPDHYRAPEVILGCGWDSSADIWNFGVMVWNMIENTELFRQVHNDKGRYDSKAHLAEMIALLGPPPSQLLARSIAMEPHKWPHSIENEAGQICRNAQEFFGGPFFDEDGNFFYHDLIPARNLEDHVPSAVEEERHSFLSFIRAMITWLPEERKTARELIEHPFLKLGST